MTAYLHPDLAPLAEGADEPLAVPLVAAGVVAAGAVTWTAEQAAEVADTLRAELGALDGWHPLKRRRIAAELGALDALAELVDADEVARWSDLDGNPEADEAGAPAPWAEPTGWEVAP